VPLSVLDLVSVTSGSSAAQPCDTSSSWPSTPSGSASTGTGSPSSTSRRTLRRGYFTTFFGTGLYKLELSSKGGVRRDSTGAAVRGGSCRLVVQRTSRAAPEEFPLTAGWKQLITTILGTMSSTLTIVAARGMLVAPPIISYSHSLARDQVSLKN